MIVVACGDLHSGHRGGLTPPAWFDNGERPSNLRALQEEGWKRWKKLAKKYAKPDVLICNGDAIDGRGERSGSRELVSVDRMDQVHMAQTCLSQFRAKHVVLSRGTPYHTGNIEDFEDLIAERLGAEIHNHPFIDIGGVMFDVKHKVGGSQIPHGRHTAIARARLQNVLWSLRETQPKAAVLLRSHVHFHNYCGGADWLAMTLPCLQMGSDYGTRQCEGIVDWGIVVFDIEKGRVKSWQAETTQLVAGKSQVLKYS